MKNHKMKQDRFKIQAIRTGRIELPGSICRQSEGRVKLVWNYKSRNSNGLQRMLRGVKGKGLPPGVFK